MTTVLVSVLTLIGGAVVSGALTYIGTKRKMALDYDADLRERRINAYRDLWKRLEPLSKYVPAAFSHDVAQNLAESLRTWYFHDGGLFLSTAARNDCFALQDILDHITTSEWGWETPEKRSLTPATRELLRAYGSRLRTGLTLDVGTRTRPKMKGNVEPVNRQIVGTYKRDSDNKEIRLAFRPRILGGTRLLSIKSAEGISISVRKWSPSRMTIRVVINNQAERVLLVERGQLLEGPSRDEDNPGAPAAWRQTVSGGV